MSSTGNLHNQGIAPGYTRGCQLMGCNRVLLWVPSDAGHGCTLVPVLLSGPVLFLPAVPVRELPTGLWGKPEFEEMLSGFCFQLFPENRRDV